MQELLSLPEGGCVPRPGSSRNPLLLGSSSLVVPPGRPAQLHPSGRPAPRLSASRGGRCDCFLSARPVRPASKLAFSWVELSSRQRQARFPSPHSPQGETFPMFRPPIASSKTVVRLGREIPAEVEDVCFSSFSRSKVVFMPRRRKDLLALLRTLRLLICRRERSGSEAGHFECVRTPQPRGCSSPHAHLLYPSRGSPSGLPLFPAPLLLNAQLRTMKKALQVSSDSLGPVSSAISTCIIATLGP